MVACDAGESTGHVHDDLSVRLFDCRQQILRDESRTGDIADDRVGEVSRLKIECKISSTVLHVQNEGGRSVPKPLKKL